MESATQSLSRGLGTFFEFVPQLIGAIIILIVGYIVAKILQAVVGRVLKAVGFDGWMERSGIKQFFDRAQTNQTPATILGKLVFWFVFIIAITMATDAFGVRQVSEVLARLIAYIPNIIAAVLILLGAVALAATIAFGWGRPQRGPGHSRERLREARRGQAEDPAADRRPGLVLRPPPAPRRVDRRKTGTFDSGVRIPGPTRARAVAGYAARHVLVGLSPCGASHPNALGKDHPFARGARFVRLP